MKLTYQARKQINKDNFVFPEKAPGPGSYPIEDLAHGRAALQMGAKFASPSDYATIKRKVYAKYPQLGKKSHFKNWSK